MGRFIDRLWDSLDYKSLCWFTYFPDKLETSRFYESVTFYSLSVQRGTGGLLESLSLLPCSSWKVMALFSRGLLWRSPSRPWQAGTSRSRTFRMILSSSVSRRGGADRCVFFVCCVPGGHAPVLHHIEIFMGIHDKSQI